MAPIVRRRWRAAVVIAFALGAAACNESSQCDNRYAAFHLHVSYGREFISSYQVSGACIGGGTGADCNNEFCGRGATICACNISVPVRLKAGVPPSTVDCHIEVKATDGSVFSTDVAVIAKPGQCPNVLLAEPDRSITVDFSADGGVRP